MWSGSTGNIPTGWTLCDGTDGAPDLRDRFIAGAGGQYNSNDTGGEDDVTLTESELPGHNHSGSTNVDGAHNHEVLLGYGSGSNFDRPTVLGRASSSDEKDLNNPSYGNSNGNGDAYIQAGSHSHNLTTNNTGGDQAHENRPQFYALAFIYKL